MATERALATEAIKEDLKKFTSSEGFNVKNLRIDMKNSVGIATT